MTFVKILTGLMFFTLFREAPLMRESEEPYHIEHKKDIPEMAQIFYNTGNAGELVSPNIDPLILAGMSWEESRWRQRGKDGDPRYIRGQGYVGMSVGPMQITKAAPRLVKFLDQEYQPQWIGLTVSQLRDPKTNIQFAYTLLQYYKGKCGGSPSVWIDAYGRGKCPKVKSGKPQIGWKAKRRCKNTDWFISQFKKQDNDFVVPEGYSCL